MKIKFAKFLLLIVVLFFSSQIFAQKNEQFKRTDVVYLRNGSIFRGIIKSYEVKGELKLEIEKGQVIVFDARNVKKVVQEPHIDEQVIVDKEPSKQYAFREEGLYYATSIGYIGGNDLWGNYTDAFNLHFLSGFQFNRWVGAGLGVGVDFYNVNLGTVIPVYAEGRGYFKAKNFSPFYQVAAGWGFPIINEDSFYSEKKGGYYLAPALGLRFGGSNEANLFTTIGLQWQQATYTQDFGDGISNNKDTYTYRRFNFKVGVLF